MGFNKNIFSFWFLIMLVSCSTKSIVTNDKIIITKEIYLKKKFKNLLIQTQKIFKEKYEKDSNVIIIDFTVEPSLIIITNQFNNYINQEEMEILNENFLGGAVLNKSIIFVKKNEIGYYGSVKLFDVSDRNINLPIHYGGEMDFNELRYIYESGEFILKKSTELGDY